MLIKFFKKIFIFCIVIFSVYTNIYGQRISERKFKKIIEKEDSFNGSIVSAVFLDIKKDKNIVDFQSNRYMTPASNIKLLTFLATISIFDSIPSLEYIRKNNKFYFRSTGYPLLGHPKYEDKVLAEFLKKQPDSLVYIENKKNINSLGPGWAWDDQGYYFSSERSFSPFHGNVVKLYKTKKDLSLKFFPKYFEKNKNLIKNISNWNDITNIKAKDTLFIPFSTKKVSNRVLLSEYLDRKVLLADDFTEIKNQFKTFYSGFEKQLFKALLHDSDNLIAESLLLMVSNYFKNDLDNKKTINDFILVNFPGLKNKPIWHDGSGLSRYNMLTTSSIIQVLKKIHDKIGTKKIMVYFPEIKADSKRLSFFDQENGFKLFAKTGTLSNNHSLSGYIFKGEKLILFSFMVNHHNRSLMDIQKALGKIITKVLDRI